jgi:phosphatidylglycerophosphatase A
VAEHHFGRIDPAPVVLDEVVGMLITLAFLPVSIGGALVGFLVFRILDVIKPWPSARFESLPGGLGVMADDGMAAVYGNLVMRGLIAVAPVGWLV